MDVAAERPPLTIESNEAAYQRLCELPVFYEVPADLTFATASIDSLRSENTISWLPRPAPTSDGNYVNPKAGPDAARLFDEAVSAFRSNIQRFPSLLTEDGRWWQYASVLKNTISTSLREVYRVTAEDVSGKPLASMDIMNCTAEEMGPGELERLQRAFERVSAFTDGKIFSRCLGITLCEDGEFRDHNLGGFMPHMDSMRLNFEAFRSTMREGIIPPRYATYFKGDKSVSAFELTIGHEFGHAMDLRNLGEVALRFLDTTRYASGHGFGDVTAQFSYFDNIPGWQHQVTEVDGAPKDTWQFDDVIGLESAEYPPTGYGYTAPAEDLGESFGIISMGGDFSNLPMRRKTIGEMVAAALGRTLGDHTISIAKVASPEDGTYQPKRLQAIQLLVGEQL